MNCYFLPALCKNSAISILLICIHFPILGLVPLPLPLLHDRPRISLWQVFIGKGLDFLFQMLLQPYRYIMQIPGKEIRKKLAVGFNYWLHIPDEKLKIVEEVVQMLHNASLLWVHLMEVFVLLVWDIFFLFGMEIHVKSAPALINIWFMKEFLWFFTCNSRLDDIEDSSILRRGMPVAHAVFGIPLTINAANYAYFLALQKALQLDHPKVREWQFCRVKYH